jgi:transglutaminase-like putative cysteine protease
MLSPEAPPPPAATPAYRLRRRLHVTHSLDYHYTGPVRHVVTRLRLTPPAARGPQRLCRSDFDAAPLPSADFARTDPNGNVVRELRHETVWKHLTFVVEMIVETSAGYTHDGHLVPDRIAPFPGDDGDVFRAPTPLTAPDSALESLAAEVAQTVDGDDSQALAFALCRRVYHDMRYVPGTTDVRTAASEAWAHRQGVCQDFAHVLITLCRLRGLPARYVSGFLPGEGAMHAWVEALLPPSLSDAGGWVALDPTHDRWVGERYVAVAHGRDYADISPTSGTFVGAGRGALTHRSRVVVEETDRVAL